MQLRYKTFFRTLLFFMIVLVVPEVWLFFKNIEYAGLRSVVLIIARGTVLVFTVSGFASLLIAGISKKWFKPVEITLILFVVSLSFLQFVHVLWFGCRPNSAVYSAMFATFNGEAIDFISIYLTASNLIAMILYGVFVSVVYGICYHVLFPKWLYKAVSWIALGIWIISLFLSTQVFNKATFRATTFSAITGYIEYRQEMQKFKRMKTQSTAHNLALDRNDFTTAEQETYIVVIGESVDRNNMSLYGYQRNTTPNLDTMDIVTLTDVVSTHTHTIEVLTKAFTVKSYTENNYYSLLDIAKQGGFATYWLSNQPLIGETDTPIGVIASMADTLISLNYGQDKSYDEAILPKLKGVLEEKERKKIIFIHLYGSHSPYKKRFPSDYHATFDETVDVERIVLSDKERSILKHYDTSIAYTDSLLQCMIFALRANRNQVSGLMFFSDHGEEVYDFRHKFTHNATHISRHTVEVPFLFWFNSKFKELASEKYTDLLVNAQKPFTFHNFPSVFMDFVDLRSEAYSDTLSIFSSKYKEPATRMISGLRYEQDLLPIFNGTSIAEIPFDHQIWAHRNNSFEDLERYQKTFTGLEIDLMYRADQNILDVNHPPAKSLGISFENYLQKFSENDSLFLWLDIKNLTVELANPIFERVDVLLEKYNMDKSRVLIESVVPEALLNFSKAGYVTSYYLPPIHTLTPEQVMPIMSKAKRLVERGQISGISQSIEGILYAQYFMPNVAKFTWALDVSVDSDQLKSFALRTLRDNDDIKVILVRKEGGSK